MKRLVLQVLLTASLVLLASAAMATTAANTQITNTATVNYNDANGVAQTPVSASVSVWITPVWGVSISPTTGSGSGNNGAKVIYTLTITNTGNYADAYNLSSSKVSGWDSSPAVYFSSQSDGSNIITSTGSVAIGGTYTAYMVVTVPSSVLDGTTNVETATATGAGSVTVNGTGYNSNAANTTGDYTTTAIGSANIPGSGGSAATKTSSTSTPVVNVPFTYTVQMTNNGTKATSNLTVTDTLPANEVYAQDSSITLNNNGSNVPQTDAADYNSGTGTITVSIGSLAPGATATITFHAKVTATGSITNTANITYDGGTPINPSNTVTGTAAPSLSLTKAVNGSTTAINVAPGATLHYTITATNGSSAGPATNVVIQDSIPANTTFVPGSIKVDSVTNTGDTYKSGNTISTPAATVAPSGTKTLEFDVTVN